MSQRPPFSGAYLCSIPSGSGRDVREGKGVFRFAKYDYDPAVEMKHRAHKVLGYSRIMPLIMWIARSLLVSWLWFGLLGLLGRGVVTLMSEFAKDTATF